MFIVSQTMLLLLFTLLNLVSDCGTKGFSLIYILTAPTWAFLLGTCFVHLMSLDCFSLVEENTNLVKSVALSSNVIRNVLGQVVVFSYFTTWSF